MKNLYGPIKSLQIAFFLFFLSGFTLLSAQEVVFFEDFGGGIPTDFTLIDVDGLTPADPVSFISEAWVADADEEGDSIAISTSWYDPAGTADDWLITPQISVPATGEFVLQWNARSFDPSFRDGYQVLISVGAAEIPDFTDVVFSVDQEIASWTTRSVSLQDYSGQDIFIAFRNNSSDQFLLAVDDISVVSKLAVDADLVFTLRPDLEYLRVPKDHVDTLNAGALVVNNGLDTLTNVSVLLDVLKGNSVVYSDLMGGPLSAFAPSDTAGFVNAGIFVPQDTGFYVVAYQVTSDQVDENPGNNVDTLLYDITDTTLARDELVFTGFFDNILGLGFGPDANSEMASLFFLRQTDIVNSVTFLLATDSTRIGERVFSSVYSLEDTLVQEIARSEEYILTADDVPFFIGTLPYTSPANLAAGEPFLVSIHETGDNPLGLLFTEELYIPRRNWIRSDSIGDGEWLPLDPDVFPSLNWQYQAVIQVNVGGCASLNGVVEKVDDDGSGNGTASVVPVGGTPPYSYEWASNTLPSPITDSVATGLSAGRYNLTLTDANGCQRVFVVLIQAGTPVKDPVELGFRTLEAYPNPTQGTLRLNLELMQPGYLEVQLYDLNGRVLINKRTRQTLNYQDELTLRVSPGTYVLKVSNAQGAVYKRIAVQ